MPEASVNTRLPESGSNAIPINIPPTGESEKLRDKGAEISSKERFDYFWKHFALTADQRVKTFHFYILLLAALLSISIGMMRPDSPFRFFLFVGSTHIFVALVFAILDWRSRDLLTISKSALKQIEDSAAFKDSPKLIVQDKAANKGTLKGRAVSYTWGFNACFIVHAIFGGALVAFPGAFVIREEIVAGASFAELAYCFSGAENELRLNHPSAVTLHLNRAAQAAVSLKIFTQDEVNRLQEAARLAAKEPQMREETKESIRATIADFREYVIPIRTNKLIK